MQRGSGFTVCLPEDQAVEGKSRDGEPSEEESLEASEDDRSLEEARRASGKLAGTSDARVPVWEDSEDEGAEINIAATNRLRKLRASEAEVTLTGSSSIYTAKLLI